jgi:Zn-dependent protease
MLMNCPRCSRELASEAVACDHCHALVHAEELASLSSAAKAFESRGDWTRARDEWKKALHLLPQDSKQASWITDHLVQVESLASQAKPPVDNSWARKLGPLAPIAIFLAKGKSLLMLLKLNFLLSFTAFIGLYWAMWGMKFGIGFGVLILIHELGHFIDIKRRGLPADMPVFLPGLGAYVRWQALGVSLEVRSFVSLAGPLAGWLGSAVCALIWWRTGDGVWAALARSNALLNVLNLIPVWVLDGGQAALALSKVQRLILVIASIGLAIFLHEKMFYLVAAGAGYRLFTKDMPTTSSNRALAYFVLLLALLGALVWLIPSQGQGL